MFNLPVDTRLSCWSDHRQQLENSENPLQEVWDFWRSTPFVPFNHNINQYNKTSWPTPWEIIVDNQYDDFTKSLMIAWTIKLTKKYNKSDVFIKSLVDEQNKRMYNVVYVDDIAINYNDEGPVDSTIIPTSYRIDNIIEVSSPR